MQANINEIINLKERQFQKLFEDIKKRDNDINKGTRATLQAEVQRRREFELHTSN